MSNKIINYIHLLDQTKTIIDHQQQLAIVKGETFNIYSLLGMETAEVKTHSKIIGELLNPKGSHLMGNKFLIEFLELPALKDNVCFDTENASAKVEAYIGKVNLKKATGGQIDILLTDGYGKTIAIENKIDAKDGEKQVKRYYNYNKNKNKVIYLSKNGKEPDNLSKGDLISGKDFLIISYNVEIIEWLEKCQEIAYDQPIVRESIKQYKILIRKITKTLGTVEDENLKAVIINNLNAASYIAANYDTIVNNIKADFREKLRNKIQLKLPEFDIQIRREIERTYSNIWFFHDSSNQKKCWFGIETFSGSSKAHGNGVLFVGICDKSNHLTFSEHKEGYQPLHKFWQYHKKLTWQDEEIFLSNIEFIKNIIDNNQLNSIVEEVAEQVFQFVDEHKSLIL